MISARDEVLRRIRVALADQPAPVPTVRDYQTEGAVPASVELFAERVADYRATVHRTTEEGLPGLLAELLPGTVVVPAGFPASWSAHLEIRSDDPPLTAADLDRLDSVLTSCAVAIAETGTIVLDGGPGMGRRVLTLVPDHHVVVVRTAQVVAGVPDALTRLDPTRPQTWISGPSATSDIELQRVERVHGPRRLDVVLVP